MCVFIMTLLSSIRVPCGYLLWPKSTLRNISISRSLLQPESPHWTWICTDSRLSFFTNVFNIRQDNMYKTRHKKSKLHIHLSGFVIPSVHNQSRKQFSLLLLSPMIILLMRNHISKSKYLTWHVLILLLQLDIVTDERENNVLE